MYEIAIIFPNPKCPPKMIGVEAEEYQVAQRIADRLSRECQNSYTKYIVLQETERARNS